MSAAFSAHLAKVKRLARLTNMKATTEDKNKCEVCGARLRGFHFHSDTCDSTCTRAKHGGRTRGEQQTYEMECEQAAWAEREHEAQRYRRDYPSDGGLNYNRPYLLECAA